MKGCKKNAFMLRACNKRGAINEAPSSTQRHVMHAADIRTEAAHPSDTKGFDSRDVLRDILRDMDNNLTVNGTALGSENRAKCDKIRGQVTFAESGMAEVSLSCWQSASG